MRSTQPFRIAASTLAIGLATTSCAPFLGQRVSTLPASAPKAEHDANKLYAKAGGAVVEGRIADAVDPIERAVALAPRDVGYRMVLGDIYLKNGRFLSAEQAFSDVLILNPGNLRASLSLALTQIAQGKTADALALLGRLEGVAPVSDLGLAYTLAGQPQRAIAMLEPAARAPEADGRVRQNLALAYAFAGDWGRARVTAAQDVSPADLAARLQQWSALTQPQAPHSQVAALLNIPVIAADSGQPAQLALAPAPVVVAEAAPAPAAPATPVAPAAVLAEAVRIDPPVTAEAAQPQELKAIATLMPPAPVRPVARAPLPAFKPALARLSLSPTPATRSGGRFVVQIGAYKNQGQAEAGWSLAQRRYGLAGDPLTTTVSIPGKGTFHRLSVSGFETARAASGVCRSIKAKGGACFVRSTAGDAPVQWASRKAGPRG